MKIIKIILTFTTFFSPDPFVSLFICLPFHPLFLLSGFIHLFVH